MPPVYANTQIAIVIDKVLSRARHASGDRLLEVVGAARVLIGDVDHTPTRGVSRGSDRRRLRSLVAAARWRLTIASLGSASEARDTGPARAFEVLTWQLVLPRMGLAPAA